MIRLLIADDHKLFRDGLRRILEMEEDLVVVGEASDGEEACRMAAALRPEVVLMDISMPTVNGVEATECIVRTVPDCRVIILSIHDDEAYVYRALSGGAKGYLLKEMDSEELIEAVRTVARGEAYIHPRVTNKVLDQLRRLREGQTPLPDGAAAAFLDEEMVARFRQLTSREREVLQLMAEGKSNRQIGEALFISEKTVKNHVSNIFQKLGVDDRTQAVVLAIKHGWVRI